MLSIFPKHASMLSWLSVWFGCVLGSGAVACGKEALGDHAIGVVGAGVVNDPGNKSLRFDLLKFGLDRFCAEMTERGVPLKLADDQPVAGRFFAQSCQSQVLDQEQRKSFVVQYSGRGYGWTNLTGRIGFSAAGLLEYAPDFQLHEGKMYIYFRPENVNSLKFETLMVESRVAQAGMSMTGVNPDDVGENIVRGQLRRGFTVIRHDSSGETEFGLGIIEKGHEPFKPFTVSHSDKRTLANQRTEVHSHQQDYIGPFRIGKDGQALALTLKLDGVSAVDVLVVPQGVGDDMTRRYVSQPGPVPLAMRPLLAEPVQQGQLYRRQVSLTPGAYYLVLDHSSVAGQSAPPAVPADAAAKIDYLVQVGDAP